MLLACNFVEEVTEMPHMAQVVGDASAQQLRNSAAEVKCQLAPGVKPSDVSAAVFRLVQQALLLPLMSPLVGEALAATTAVLACLARPGWQTHAVRVLEELARFVSIFQPYAFSCLCRGAVLAGDSPAQRMYVALSGACTWLFACFCRALGYDRLTSEVLWDWADGDAAWVALLAKATLTLDDLVRAVPDTTLSGVLVTADLDQLKDAVSGAMFGLVSPTVAFADVVARADGPDGPGEIYDPEIALSQHWARLGAAVTSANLLGPLLEVVESHASGRRAELAAFLAKLLAVGKKNPPGFTADSPLSEAMTGAAALVGESLMPWAQRLWALMRSEMSPGRIPRSFVRDCADIAQGFPPVFADEVMALIEVCISGTIAAELASADNGGLAMLCRLAASSGAVPHEGVLLCDFLLDLPADLRAALAATLRRRPGAREEIEEEWLALLEFSQAADQGRHVRETGGLIAATPLQESQRCALGLGGLEELLAAAAAPAELRCALDGKLLTNPVRSPHGHVFEYVALSWQLAENGGSCPLTGEALSLDDCQPDFDLRRQSLAHIKRWARGIRT
eukprot:TRINITY_DN20736_c0_g1_i1.p1 TRINITY_DN20736_c0_g1~~TRINITY_DN20736_c0_g1_i1.p1  ORF type:complete len:647 (+),score=110.37 TRINITY_DN20736_c0_g1_i1:246-1943(+)